MPDPDDPDRLSMVPCSACAMRVLQVFDDTEPNGNHRLIGTITEVAGGEPVCDPEWIACLLNRPRYYGVDPFAALDDWTNGYVTCGLEGGAPTITVSQVPAATPEQRKAIGDAVSTSLAQAKAKPHL